ncbi:MAG: 50S ribosomal protein L21 [Planctomycetota bacterium]|nr:MAG: 50S ribosomal protein L21 [Planctomycetota bacterium]
MYAIIKDGTRQYRVEAGQELEVDYRETPKGEQITFDSVLALRTSEGLQLGRPTLDGAVVTAEVLGPVFGEKIYVEKFRRRKNYHRRKGHRQLYTKVKITGVQVNGQEVVDQPAEASEAAE